VKTISNKNLLLLLSGQLISQIGDKFYALALAYWVLQTTHSPSKMGIMLFASMAPSIVIGLFSGGVIDMINRRAILVITDVIRGLIVTSVAVFYFIGALNMLVIISAEVILSICSAFYDPATQAIIPQIVESENLAKANAKSQLIGGIALIIGPVMGGICAAYLGYGFVFLFNAASFFIASFSSFLIIYNPASIKLNTEKKIIANIKSGFHYVFTRRSIISIVFIVAILHFFVGSVQVIMPVFAMTLNGNGAQNLGYLETFYGAGIIIAGLSLSIININNKERYFMFGGISFIGIVYTSFGLLCSTGQTNILPYFVIFFLMSAAVVMISTSYRAILQKNIENDMAGRVFGIISSVGNFTYPIALLTVGLILDKIKFEQLLIICGLMILLFSIALLRLARESHLN
jgi:MFS family permease